MSSPFPYVRIEVLSSPTGGSGRKAGGLGEPRIMWTFEAWVLFGTADACCTVGVVVGNIQEDNA